MSENALLGLTTIVVLGIAAQWLAWRLRLPSILLLLGAGFVAGPVTGILNPDALLGDLLFPLVSVAVALILFEGGLSLKLSELQLAGSSVRNLVSIGVVVTWLFSGVAAFFILGFPIEIAALFGAVLVVTGPTVIIPILRQIRVTGQIGSVVKWEGIINDPIGAVLAVIVFEVILAETIPNTTGAIVYSLLATLFDGLVFGGLGALLLIFLLRRYWVPDYLRSSVTLMIVLAAFAASNFVQQESGLFTVTLMGVILANQKSVNVRQIVEFKENLGVLLLSILFIILSARLDLETLTVIGADSMIFLAVLVLLVRPISVFLSTIGTGLNWKEKVFLSWMAPRGIVAAAVTAVFALELHELTSFESADLMVPQMFLVIVGTVAIYGLSAAPLGRWLGVAQPNPQGVIFVGAQPWDRDIAKTLQEHGYEVLMVDTNRDNLAEARLAGLETVYASILSEYVLDEIELGGMGRLMAMTANDEVNALATLQFSEVFDRSALYQLAPKNVDDNSRQETVSSPLRGRLLFNRETTFADLDERFHRGDVIKTTEITEAFTYDDFREEYGDRALAMFLIDAAGDLTILTTEDQLLPQPGDTLISLVDESKAVKKMAEQDMLAADAA